jgi:drug/metabolite transporter (DMT)-like permease
VSAAEWLRLRAVELAAAGVTAALLIGGLAAGVPFLLDRIPEVFLYSFCCLAAVLLHAIFDLALLVWRMLLRRLRPSTVPARGYATPVIST